MIRTVGDLLKALVDAELPRLAEFSDVRHPGIIGDMYEGLTSEVAQKALSPAANLRVVGGQIRNAQGAKSRQIDCMIVDGEGIPIPFTNHWIYDVDQVVAVVEVKKSLYGADLSDSVDLMADLWRRIFQPKAIRSNLLRDAWRSIHASELPSGDDLAKLRETEQLLYHTLVVEAGLPLRIILGYEGYRSEHSLRGALVDLLTNRLAGSTTGAVALSPLSLPNLIICRDASLVKLNGMPFAGPYQHDDGRWGFMGSRNVRPLDMFLELLWTRLSYYYDAPVDIFGDDLDAEGFHLLLEGRLVPYKGSMAWQMESFDVAEEMLSKNPSEKDWEPALLSCPAFTAVNRLCNGAPVDLADPDLLQCLEDEGTTVEALVRELQVARLAYVIGGRLELLTEQCACVIDPELGFVAADNKTGRLDRWVARRMATKDRK